MNEHDDKLDPLCPWAPHGLNTGLPKNPRDLQNPNDDPSQNPGASPPNDALGNPVSGLPGQPDFSSINPEPPLPDFPEQVSIPNSGDTMKPIDPPASEGIHSDNSYKDYFENEQNNNHGSSDTSHETSSISHQDHGIDHDPQTGEDIEPAEWLPDYSHYSDLPNVRGRGGQKRVRPPYIRKPRTKKSYRPRRKKKTSRYTCANCGAYTLDRLCYYCGLEFCDKLGLCHQCMETLENGECVNENCRMSHGSGCPECGEEQCSCIR